MNSQEYFEETETAIKQLFVARKYYREQLKGIVPPVLISTESNEKKREKEFKKFLKKNQKVFDDAYSQQEKHFGLTLSNVIICGSILQIAFMGIKTFSTNSGVPEKFNFLISNPNNAIRKFCIGRKVNGVPLGMIIYAARNQYNHMDERLSNRTATIVFDTLAEYKTEGKYKDPAFDLKNTILKNNYSHNIIALLNWNDYENYIADMKEMLEK